MAREGRDGFSRRLGRALRGAVAAKQGRPAPSDDVVPAPRPAPALSVDEPTGPAASPRPADPETVDRPDDVVREAYAAWAEEYTARFGSIDDADPRDRQFVADWARGCGGRIVDVGCGPGHWTDFMAGLGAEAEGVDLVPTFVERAQARFPTRSFRVGRVDDLGLEDASVAGILAWYSLIHREPATVPRVLRELARCLRPGGSLLVGFMTGERLDPFAHRVIEAWSWPVDELTSRLVEAGFVVTDVRTRPNPVRPDRPLASIVATRLPLP